MVRASHERFDGAGYPDGLAGASIPLGARIVAVCDAYHAMTGGRPYRAAIEPDEAMHELRRCSGAQFDPDVVETFCELLSPAAARDAVIRPAGRLPRGHPVLASGRTFQAPVQMMFSTKAEYGVRVMAHLAGRDGEGPASLASIAEAEGLPLAYLEHLAARLRRAELVESTRGARGGYSLAQARR